MLSIHLLSSLIRNSGMIQKGYYYETLWAEWIIRTNVRDLKGSWSCRNSWSEKITGRSASKYKSRVTHESRTFMYE